MNLDEFESSLAGDSPPRDLSPYLTALWRERKGDWTSAHEIVQEIEDDSAAWVHAYLHRREGDEGNARYWYRRAGRPFPAGRSLDEEWFDLVGALLK